MVCPCTMLVPMVALAPLAEKACASPMGRATMTALAPFLLLAAAMAGGYVEAAQVSVRQGWSRSSDLSVVASPCFLALAFAVAASPDVAGSTLSPPQTVLSRGPRAVIATRRPNSLIGGVSSLGRPALCGAVSRMRARITTPSVLG